MRKVLFMVGGLFIAGFLFTSCSSESAEPVRIAPESLDIEWMTPQLADYFMQYIEKRNVEMASQNNGGASFIEPFQLGTSVGVLDFLNGSIASFELTYDDNDFWRRNPDGTVSLHANSDEAIGSYFEFYTGVEYVGNPDGHLNLNWTGDLIQDTLYFDADTLYLPDDTLYFPADTFYLNFLTINTDYNASVWQGRGEVYNVMDPDDVKTLRIRSVRNPGGGGGTTYSLD